MLLKSTSVHDDPRGFQCKIGDFGLSRVLEADNAHVTTNTYGARHNGSLLSGSLSSFSVRPQARYPFSQQCTQALGE